MKIHELIAYARGVRPESPSHAFSDEIMCAWINEIEGLVQSEILLTSPADIITYSLPDDENTELLVPAPHSKIYRAYLCAMIDFENGEYNKYSNTMELFNQWWREYAAWYSLNFDPASGRGEFKGYYVSAYAIAVKHGFIGTEEEWLSELDLRTKEARESAEAAERSAEAASDSASDAEAAAATYPKIGDDGYWQVWDVSSGGYVSTGVLAQGERGDSGNGIVSVEHIGSEPVSNTIVGGSGYNYSDVYTITFTDGSTTNFRIPRGARWFSGTYSGAGTNVTGICLALGALSGDYFLSTVTGNVWMCTDDNANVWQYLMCIKGNITLDEIDPEKVVFPDGLQTTYELGKVKLENGIASLVEPGGNLLDFFNVFVDEKTPETTNPSVSLTFGQAKAYEVGTKVTPSYSAIFNPGSYTYEPTVTGVAVTAWAVTDTSGNSKDTASGSFPELTVADGISYKITAKATHGDGAIPLTNTGNEYPDGQIKAGTKSATSGALTGYRNTFYGTLTAKSDPTSDIIRGLVSKSGKALSNGNSFTITIPVGALRVVFAYPATLRDVTSVKDVNGMSAEISSSFTKQTVDVEGAGSYTAISYKVYVLDFANANDTANKFTVTI